ncbi:VOC family protein [Streptomyces bobili]|uniref:VOC family protein n=1 Tax=Streptomyces bobili TaxID=67280 RepID=UPI0037B8B922
MKISSLIIRVSDLDRSIDFYKYILDLELALRENNLALLASADGSQIYLHAQKSQHVTSYIGLHAAAWMAETKDELLSIEARFKQLKSHLRTITDEAFVIVEGRDPDGIVVLVAHHTGSVESVRRTIISAVATW